MGLFVLEPPGLEPAIDALLDRCFGPNRRAKTVERLRHGRLPAEGLSLCHIDDDGGMLIATLRFWHIRIGSATDALLLGPIAVAPEHRGENIGDAMIRRGLAMARARGHRCVILVGDEPYYRRFGFSRTLTERMALPGPVDRARFLGLELVPGALRGAAGLVRGTGARRDGESILWAA